MFFSTFNARRFAGLLMLTCFSIMLPVLGQDIEDWEPLTPADFLQDSENLNNETPAIILQDFGAISFSARLEVMYERRRRILIADESAFDSWGTVRLIYHSADHLQQIKGIEAFTINRDEDGQLTRTPLDEASIFIHQIDESLSQVSFTLPALKKGSIIEYRYLLVSDGVENLPNWQFQDQIPIISSIVRVQLPAGWKMDHHITGSYEPIEMHRIDKAPVLRNERFWFINRNVSTYSWEMKNMPALKNEVLAPTHTNNHAGVSFQLNEILTSAGFTTLISSWSDIADQLLSMRQFGRRMAWQLSLKKIARDLVEHATTSEEKLKIIYSFVRDHSTWNGKDEVLAGRPLKTAWESAQLTSSEQSLVLVTMLRAVGFEAHPALTSTRQMVSAEWNSLAQFNRVVAAVNYNGQDVLLDATSPNRPWYLTPTWMVGNAAWVIDDDNQRWINTGTPAEHSQAVTSRVVIEKNGDITGYLQIHEDDYAALKGRELIASRNIDAYFAERVFGSVPGVRPAAYAVRNLTNPNLPLISEIHFTIPQRAMSVGNRIYINPILFEGLKRTPFTQSHRTLPIYFSLTKDLFTSTSLAIPRGYQLEEKNENILLELPEKLGFYERSIEQSGNLVLIQRRLIIKRQLVNPSDYEIIKSFYEQIIIADAEQIVLINLDANQVVATKQISEIAQDQEEER